MKLRLFFGDRGDECDTPFAFLDIGPPRVDCTASRGVRACLKKLNKYH